MSNIALGRYIPYDSLLHRLDPRIKISAMFLYLIAVFLPVGFLGYGILGAVLLLGVLMSKIKLSFILKSMRPMLFMLIFLLIINVFVIKTGVPLFSVLSLTVYSDALIQVFYIMVRLLLMITVTTILTATTKPLDLTLGIEDLLGPLKRFKVPAHEIAMMISIALRFIPTLIDETYRIMKAQASRGVDLKEGKMREKVMGILSLIIPLFVSSFQRAEDLADAMEARGYFPGKTRTRYKQLKIKRADILFLMFTGTVLAGMIVLVIL